MWSPAAAEEAEEQLLDTVMLRLRMADGLDLDRVAASFGFAAAEAIVESLKEHIGAGLVNKTLGYNQRTALGTVSLSDPEGFLMSNDIISDVFLALNELPQSSDGDTVGTSTLA